MIKYLVKLTVGKIILWCYLIWYGVTLFYYFDPSPRLWLNSLGISVIIGFALLLSVSRVNDQPPDHWQTFRLFMMPFCVSSFSSLIKNQGFMLVLPPNRDEQVAAIVACLVFIAVVNLLKRVASKPACL